MPLPQADLAVVAVGGPLLVGVYRDGELVEVLEREGKLSETLAPLFDGLLERYDIRSVHFSRGPGSLMSVKLLYIFLKTLAIAKDIELYGCESFAFSGGAPIKAVGNLYFVKKEGAIATKNFKEPPQSSIRLPQRLGDLGCGSETEPIYHIPAVEV